MIKNIKPLILTVFFVSLSKGEAAAIETELLRDYRFGQQQLIEIWGHACALAITKVTPSTLKVLCFFCVFFLTIQHEANLHQCIDPFSSI